MRRNKEGEQDGGRLSKRNQEKERESKIYQDIARERKGERETSEKSKK
jgi:hypothetical protein